MPDTPSLKRFEIALESSLAEGWRILQADGLLPELIGYDIIAPEGMESVEPFVLTRADAAARLAEWESPDEPPYTALLYPSVNHQGGRLEIVFQPATEAYQQIEITEAESEDPGARAIIENVAARVFRRLLKKGCFGDRSGDEGAFLGFFGYETGEEVITGHLREINPPDWVDRWFGNDSNTPPGELRMHGKSANADVSVDDLTLHPAAGLVVNTSWGGLVRFWDLKDLSAPIYSRTDWEHGVTAHAATTDGEELYLAWRNTIRKTSGLLAMHTKKRKRRDLGLRLRDESWALACHPREPWLAIGTKQGQVVLWDVKLDVEVKRWSGLRGSVRSLVFSPDGRTVFAGARENRLVAWDITEDRQMFALPLCTESITPTPDGRELVVLACDINDSSIESYVTFVDAQSGQVSRTINLGASEKHSDSMSCGARCAAISSDGSRLALGVGFGVEVAHVRLLDYTSGQEIARANLGHEYLNGLAFMPGDRTRLLCTGRHHRGAPLYEWVVP